MYILKRIKKLAESPESHKKNVFESLGNRDLSSGEQVKATIEESKTTDYEEKI